LAGLLSGAGAFARHHHYCVGQAAIFVSPKSFMIQYGGLLALTSMTEWTSPVTSVPSMATLFFGRDVDHSGSVSRLLGSSRTIAYITK
jgi:hypothetical protein